MTGVDSHWKDFLEVAVPKVLHKAGSRWRHIRCASTRDDLIQEALGLAWRDWLRCLDRGRDPRVVAWAIAMHAVLRAARGQTIHRGPANCRRFDTSVGCQPTHHEISLPQSADEDASPEAAEALQDRRGAEPWQLAVVNLDWTEFLSTLTPTERRLMELGELGHSVKHTAQQLGIGMTHAVSLRARCRERWLALTR